MNAKDETIYDVQRRIEEERGTRGMILRKEESFARNVGQENITERTLEKDLQHIESKCADTESVEWNVRVKAMNRIRAWLVNGAQDLEPFPLVLEQLISTFQVQLLDARSTVVREITDLLIFMRDHLEDQQFNSFAAAIIPTLLKLTIVTVRVIAESADMAVKHFLKTTKMRQIVRLFASEVCTAKHHTLRKRNAEYLFLSIQHNSKANVRKYLGDISKAIVQALGDREEEARSLGRACFWALHARFTKEAEAVRQKLKKEQLQLLDAYQPIYAAYAEHGQLAPLREAKVARGVRPTGSPIPQRLAPSPARKRGKGASPAPGGMRAGGRLAAPGARPARAATAPEPSNNVIPAAEYLSARKKKKKKKGGSGARSPRSPRKLRGGGRRGKKKGLRVDTGGPLPLSSSSTDAVPVQKRDEEGGIQLQYALSPLAAQREAAKLGGGGLLSPRSPTSPQSGGDSGSGEESSPLPLSTSKRITPNPARAKELAERVSRDREGNDDADLTAEKLGALALSDDDLDLGGGRGGGGARRSPGAARAARPKSAMVKGAGTVRRKKSVSLMVDDDAPDRESAGRRRRSSKSVRSVRAARLARKQSDDFFKGIPSVGGTRLDDMLYDVDQVRPLWRRSRSELEDAVARERHVYTLDADGDRNVLRAEMAVTDAMARHGTMDLTNLIREARADPGGVSADVSIPLRDRGSGSRLADVRILHVEETKDGKLIVRATLAHPPPERAQSVRMMRKKSFSRFSGSRRRSSNGSEPKEAADGERSGLTDALRAKGSAAAAQTGYVVVKDLGEGSFGRVRLCRRVADDMLVAVKIVDLKKMKMKTFGMQSSDSPLERMREEIAVMKKLAHQNTVPLVEAIRDDAKDRLYLVEEYVPDGPLQGRIPLSEDKLRPIARGIFLGVEYLHTQRIAHRDIKPENILMAGDTPKLGDFGSARLLHEKDIVTDVQGTPSFMPPEMVNMKADIIEYNAFSADVWAFGVLLYNCVSGKYPFDGDSVGALYKSIADCKVSYPKEFSKNLRSLLKGIFVKDPKKRLSLADIRVHAWMTNDGNDPVPLQQVERVRVSEEDIRASLRLSGDPF